MRMGEGRWTAGVELMCVKGSSWCFNIEKG